MQQAWFCNEAIHRGLAHRYAKPDIRECMLRTAGAARGAGRGAGRGRAKFNDPEDIQFIKILKGHDRQITALLIDAANNQASPWLPVRKEGLG